MMNAQLYQQVILKSQLPLQETAEDITVYQNHSEDLLVQEADGEVESHLEELLLQKTVSISENQEVVASTKAVLDNSSETLLKVVTKDFESLSEENLRNTLISNMQTKQHANKVSS